MSANASNTSFVESLAAPQRRPLAWLVLASALALLSGLAHASWTTAIQLDPITHQSRCLLSSEQIGRAHV